MLSIATTKIFFAILTITWEYDDHKKAVAKNMRSMTPQTETGYMKNVWFGFALCFVASALCVCVWVCVLFSILCFYIFVFGTTSPQRQKGKQHQTGIMKLLEREKNAAAIDKGVIENLHKCMKARHTTALYTIENGSTFHPKIFFLCVVAVYLNPVRLGVTFLICQKCDRKQEKSTRYTRPNEQTHTHTHSHLPTSNIRHKQSTHRNSKENEIIGDFQRTKSMRCFQFGIGTK